MVKYQLVPAPRQETTAVAGMRSAAARDGISAAPALKNCDRDSRVFRVHLSMAVKARPLSPLIRRIYGPTRLSKALSLVPTVANLKRRPHKFAIRHASGAT